MAYLKGGVDQKYCKMYSGGVVRCDIDNINDATKFILFWNGATGVSIRTIQDGTFCFDSLPDVKCINPGTAGGLGLFDISKTW